MLKISNFGRKMEVQYQIEIYGHLSQHCYLPFLFGLCGGVLVKYTKEFGFNFGLTDGLINGSENYINALKEVNNLYYTLPAIAGLAGPLGPNFELF